jgi:hypothetical protein
MASDMLCVIAPYYTKPAGFEQGRLPIPVVKEGTDVQIEVHAASVNPVDLKKASGMLKIALRDESVPPANGLQDSNPPDFHSRSGMIVLARSPLLATVSAL